MEVGGAHKSRVWSLDSTCSDILNGEQALRKVFMLLDSHKASRHEERKLLTHNKLSYYMQCTH